MHSVKRVLVVHKSPKRRQERIIGGHLKMRNIRTVIMSLLIET
jgi:hypothetical protein